MPYHRMIILSVLSLLVVSCGLKSGHDNKGSQNTQESTISVNKTKQISVGAYSYTADYSIVGNSDGSIAMQFNVRDKSNKIIGDGLKIDRVSFVFSGDEVFSAVGGRTLPSSQAGLCTSGQFSFNDFPQSGGRVWESRVSFSDNNELHYVVLAEEYSQPNVFGSLPPNPPPHIVIGTTEDNEYPTRISTGVIVTGNSFNLKTSYKNISDTPYSGPLTHYLTLVSGPGVSSPIVYMPGILGNITIPGGSAYVYDRSMIAGEPGVYTLKISTDSPETIENTVILQFTVVATSTNG